jgi:hypothetical protein
MGPGAARRADAMTRSIGMAGSASASARKRLAGTTLE